MTYPRDTGEVSATLFSSAAAEQVSMSSGTVARFIAPGSATEGRLGLFEWNMPPRVGDSSSHFHKTFSESFYIVSGTVLLFDGNQWNPTGPGDFLYVPEGGVHGFRNESDEPARMLVLFTPGAPREEYFRELAANSAAGRKLTEEEWIELWTRHDQYPVS